MSCREDRITPLLEALRSPDLETRETAAERLDHHARVEGFDAAEGLRLLGEATRPFPERKYEWQNTGVDLIRAAGVNPHFSFVPAIVANFSDYSARAKIEALRLLTTIPDPDAARAYVLLAETHGRDGSLEELPIRGLETDPRYAEIVFPDLLELATIPRFRWNIYRLCLTYFNEGLLSPPDLEGHTASILEAYRPLRDLLEQAQKPDGLAWMWEEDYQEWRSEAGLMLDLLGYFRAPASRQELEHALNFEDPRLRLFAIVSSLRHGVEVDERRLVAVASAAETRNWLYRNLQSLGREELFPEKFQTQEHFAESDMVNWLAYPTELGRVPDEIELMEVIPVESPEGPMSYYLFRFRTHPPHWAAEDGWMAGVSGPFRRGVLSPDAYGDTFSTFESWDAKTSEEHLEEIRSLIEAWKRKAEQ